MNFVPFYLLFTLLAISSGEVRTKYSALPPDNPRHNFAFYELYPETPEGEKALARAWKLLTNQQLPTHQPEFADPFSKISISSLIKAINRDGEEECLFSDEELTFIESLGSGLKNRTLQGRTIWEKDASQTIPLEEIDLARSIFLEEYKDTQRVRSYEALIDLMALQVLAQLPKNPSPEEMIYAVNDLVFHEMGFRFPAASSWEKEIDTYTGLPSVIDSKQGVCLGVSILYLCIAQRIGLKLEAVTPPGHIYVRYSDEEHPPINIETTARGIHVPCEHYQGLALETLETKTLREVVGLVFVNIASVHWKKEEHEQAIASYKKALLYLPNDPFVWDLLAYNHLFIGQLEEGLSLLQKADAMRKEQGKKPNPISEDYLQKNASVEGISIIFSSTEDTRDAILNKREKLKTLLEKTPKFRAALMQYAQTYLQLGKEKEALAPLEQLCLLEENATVACYYLAMIYLNRYDYNKSWYYLRLLKQGINAQQNGEIGGKPPKFLEDLERSLKIFCPEPLSI